MFTGIIETIGRITDIRTEQSNKIFIIESDISKDLKIDQSLSHNGVCLTVTEIIGNSHSVTAIMETLVKSNLGFLMTGDYVNLERCLPINGRLDGHIVQGHVDQTAICTHVAPVGGSWVFKFQYDGNLGNITVEKGSICINGVSLTVVESGANDFSVAIIPYTYQHTTFKYLKQGDAVNLEFDIIGKYIKKILGNR